LVVQVTGTWGSPLGVNASDSERFSSVPNLIHIAPSESVVPAGNSPYSLSVRLTADRTIPRGSYVVAVTLTEGGVQQTAYFFVEVT
jgi:hypothetical protein